MPGGDPETGYETGYEMSVTSQTSMSGKRFSHYFPFNV